MPTPRQIKKAISDICAAAKTYGISDAFFVGGYPRALAMGTGLGDVHDLDVATGTPDKATQLAGFLAESDLPETHHRTNTVTIEMDGLEIDFQGPSAHEHTLPYLHAAGVDPTPVAMNIFDRDFTINSLAIPVGTNEILDLTSRGIRDIEDKRIATIAMPNDIVPRDPLVITRAVRFAHKYGFSIDGRLWKAMKDFSHVVPQAISRKRLVVEAHTLAQYDTMDTLKELGLEFLGDLAKEFVDE